MKLRLPGALDTHPNRRRRLERDPTGRSRGGCRPCGAWDGRLRALLGRRRNRPKRLALSVPAGSDGASAVRKQREIAVLNELVHATCQSADRFAAAGRICTDAYRKMVLDQLCEARRLLLIDLIRCLLLRGVPVPDVRKAVTAIPPSLTVCGDDAIVSADIGIAERKLHATLRRALSDPCLSEPVQELLSLHYLRFELHHDDLADIPDMPPALAPAPPRRRLDA